MSWSEEEQAVLSVMRAEWRAFYAGDFDALARCWLQTPDARRMISGPEFGSAIATGWEELSKQYRVALENFPQDYVADDWLRWDGLALHVGGDVAWASYDQVAIQFTDGLLASPLTHEVKILHRTDEGWKLAAVSMVIPGIGRDHVPQVEIDLDGKVSRVNGPARERLEDHPGLVLSGTRLRARNRAYDPGLQAEIAQYCRERSLWPPRRRRLDCGATPLGEDDYGRPLYCWVTVEQNKILVSFDDTAQVKRRLALAAETYGLSPAQLALCEALAEGADLNAAAETLGVSVNTVRTQLRRMFDKTGTHSQTALLSALLAVRRPR